MCVRWREVHDIVQIYLCGENKVLVLGETKNVVACAV